MIKTMTAPECIRGSIKEYIWEYKMNAYNVDKMSVYGDKIFVSNGHKMSVHLGDKSISRFVYTTSRHQKRMYFGCL